MTHAERIDAIRFQVQVPGTQISAELSRRDQIRIDFGSGANYRQLSDSDVEHYLGALARLLFANWLRAYRQTLDEHIVIEPGIDNWQDREFYEAREKIVGQGASADGRIQLIGDGLRNVTVKLAPGTVSRLSEDECADGVRVAAAALIEDYTGQVAELKERIYR
ncbi:hypothetical protein BJ973_000474 [Actinoplanes tereljensis]|uniref:Uncharacterized protein n=1 Tax=Paractinoplanes tereljensis TaxID=571912 RepID=A0A919NQG2_9ACTN|nr:hypothetical protein [Actinoplanes tereljensis]GIF23170.1 hypothetical protein Ate02nite_59000 [Actinoplanes tereljensis]